MNYNKFGKLFRTYRINHGENLKDAGQFLGVTSSFVSAVELGKRKIPKDWLQLIVNHYNLNAKEEKELAIAIEESKTSLDVNLTKLTPLQKTVALAFQRSFNNISDETATTILKILEEGNGYGLQNKENIKKKD